MNPKIARDIELHLPLRATKAAVVRVYPQRTLTEGQRVQLARVPGVCPKPQVVFTPPSVLPTIERAVAHYAGVSRVDIPSSVLVPEYREEDESRYIPREARPTVTWREFQRDGLQFSAPRAGVQLWWACLAREMEVTVNRQGAARRISISDLYDRLNGVIHPRAVGQARAGWDVDTQTQISSADPEGFCRLSEIEAVVFSGVQEVLRLELADGKHLRATADHVICTSRGEVPLGELRPGDHVLTLDPNRTRRSPGRGRQADGTRPKYKVVAAMHNHPYASKWQRVRKDRPGPTRAATVPLHRIVYEAVVLNEVSTQEFVRRIKEGRIEGLQFVDPATHEVHHRDHDTLNNDPSNLEQLGRSEHHAEHGRDGKWKHAAFRAEPVRVLSVLPDGISDTYDIILRGPHHQFFANGVLVHNCGAGKAPTGIVAAHQSDGLIVIVTKADVRPHYRSQVRKFTTTIPYVYGRDAPETRAETMERYVERCRADGVRPLIVTGYEGLKVLIDRIKPLRPSVCVFDEVHKAAESRRTYTVQIGDGKTRRRLGNISDVCEQLSLACERRIATSRTPIPDRRRALWSVIELTNPGEFGGQYGYVPFALRYCGGSFNPEYGGMYDQGKSATPELRARLKHFVHFVPQHILQAELPPLTREVRYIPAECQNAAASVAGEMKEAKRARDRARAAHVKLLQICSRKRDTVVEICEEAYHSGQKVLVLTGRQNEVIAIRNALCKCLGFDPADVNGPADTEVPIWTSHDDGADGHAKIMGSEERNRRRMAYMDDPDPDTNQRVRGEGHPAIYIGTIESTGESQDFQDTDLIVFAMLSWRPKDYIQGEGRGGRIGQLRPLRIIYLICEGTSEEFIATAVIEKMGDVSDLMGDAYLAQLAEDMEGMDDPALETALIDVVLQRKVSAVSARAPEPPPMPEESNDVEDWEL